MRSRQTRGVENLPFTSYHCHHCRIQTLREAGGPVIQTLLDKGVAGGFFQKKFFRPSGPQFRLKIRAGGRLPRAPPLDLPLVINLSLLEFNIKTCSGYNKTTAVLLKELQVNNNSYDFHVVKGTFKTHVVVVSIDGLSGFRL